jgi:glutamine synthetase
VEHRIAGADANLYLAVAAVLGAAAHGLRQKIDPGLPVAGNGYTQPGERTLPGSWREALNAAAGSQFLRDCLGAEFMKIFLAIKQQECARFCAEVSELDYAWYLRS